MKEVYDRWKIGFMNINITEKEIHQRAGINGERHGEIKGERNIGEINWESGGESGERRESKGEKDEDREIKIEKD